MGTSATKLYKLQVKASKPLVIREINATETTGGYHCTHIRMAKIAA